MPWGYLASSALALLGVVLVLAAPALPRRLAGLSSWAGVLVGEAPAVVLLWLVASTLLLVAQGDAAERGAWLALGVAALAAAGLVRCLVLGVRAGAVLDRAVPASGEPARRVGAAGWLAAAVVPLPRRPRDVTRQRDLAYGPAPHQRVDLYRSRSVPASGAVLVQLHGGGFFSGHKSRESLPLIYDLAGLGWTCLSGDYRLSRTPAEGHPGHLVDVKQLIAWVRTQGETWGVAPATIVLVGTSAGAHLSAMAALTANQPAYQPGFEDADTSVDGFVGLAGYYGPVSGVDGDGTSPFDHLEGAGTPVLIVHGTHDVVASPDAAARLAGALAGTGRSDVALALLPGAHHTFDLLDSVRFRQVRRGVARFCAAVAESDAPGPLPRG